MLLLLDNYDSFTYNLYHYLGELGADVVVRRNDAMSAAEALALRPRAIVISPGPCDPDRAGISLDLVRAAADFCPILGVCLGHQAIAQAFGGRIVRAPQVMHGKLSAIEHDGSGLFRGLPAPFMATRYHSLVADPAQPAGLPRGHRPHRRRRDHGARPPRAADLRRPVPSGEHRDRARPSPARQFPLRDSGRGGGMSAGPDRMKALLALVAGGERLSLDQARSAFEIMMSGDATPAQVGAFLMGLRVRGETVDELTGGAEALRERMVKVEAPADAIDTCGTGGDSSGTFNVSTAAALVVAACGVPVAKHGNRALSSKAGSADILAALGVNLDVEPARVERAIREAGIGFMMAPRHHGAMRHVAGARVELGTRTIFNLLGPLANPAGARRQLLGVFAHAWIEPLARVLGQLGSERAWVVHGSDGLDELTTTGPSHVAELRKGTVATFEVTPEQAGLPRARSEDLRGADAATNADALRALLDGVRGPYRDIVLLNSAAALVIADRARDLAAGVGRAVEAIDSGAAKAALARLVAISSEAPPGD